MISHRLGYMVVEEARGFQGVFGHGPVVKEHRYSGEYLLGDVGMITLFFAGNRIEGVLVYLSEHFVALHHASLAVAFFQVDEFAIAKLLCPVGHLLGHDVGVYIDLSH